jgi:hypothetical protein
VNSGSSFGKITMYTTETNFHVILTAFDYFKISHLSWAVSAPYHLLLFRDCLIDRDVPDIWGRPDMRLDGPSGHCLVSD